MNITKIKSNMIQEVKDPYEQSVQCDFIKAGIQAHAETYSFNIESELFHQLTKEQQALWRKEIEQAVISGGEAGVELARDPRYEENLETKDVLIEQLKNKLKEENNDEQQFFDGGNCDCIGLDVPDGGSSEEDFE